MARGKCAVAACGEATYSTSGYCREHHRQYTREYREKNRDRVRELGRKNKAAERERKGPEQVRQEWRDWYQKNKEHRRSWQKRRNVPTQKRARHLLEWAVESGFIARPNRCSSCREECVPDGHHEDYSKPFDVEWLCRRCHSHKQNGAPES